MVFLFYRTTFARGVSLVLLKNFLRSQGNTLLLKAATSANLRLFCSVSISCARVSYPVATTLVAPTSIRLLVKTLGAHPLVPLRLYQTELAEFTSMCKLALFPNHRGMRHGLLASKLNLFTLRRWEKLIPALQHGESPTAVTLSVGVSK